MSCVNSKSRYAKTNWDGAEEATINYFYKFPVY